MKARTILLRGYSGGHVLATLSFGTKTLHAEKNPLGAEGLETLLQHCAKHIKRLRLKGCRPHSPRSAVPSLAL